MASKAEASITVSAIKRLFPAFTDKLFRQSPACRDIASEQVLRLYDSPAFAGNPDFPVFQPQTHFIAGVESQGFTVIGRDNQPATTVYSGIS
jgi:hypothetical protein